MDKITTYFNGGEAKGVRESLALLVLLTAMITPVMAEEPVSHPQESNATQSIGAAEQSNGDENTYSVFLLAAAGIVGSWGIAKVFPKVMTAIFDRYPEHFAPRDENGLSAPKNPSP